MEAELECSLASALQQCGRARTYDALCAAFEASLRPLLEQCLSAPLAQPVRDDVSPDAAAPRAAALRVLLERLDVGDDVWFFLFRAAAALLNRATAKRARTGEALSPASPFYSHDDNDGGGGGVNEPPHPNNSNNSNNSNNNNHSNAVLRTRGAAARGSFHLSAVVVGCFVLFAGRPPPSLTALRLTWGAALRREKERLEASAAHQRLNASERRRALLHGVLAVFSERAHRHYFTALWLPCMRHAAECALHLHILHRAGDAILPHLTNPLVAADYFSGCFASGGLVAVLALRGIFVLMLDHGLEYPQFYTQLYSLVTADALASRHRYDLFRLLDLSLASARVPAYVAAAFAKRMARVALLAPTPVLYFVLPFVRRLLQRHPNCLALIHRGAREAIVRDEEAIEEAVTVEETVEAKRETLRSAAALFDGTDPFDATAPPGQCRALQSTLWELTALERHFAPAVPLMVAAFTSTAEDTAPLRVEKTYARLFTAEVTRPISRTNVPTVAYSEPSEADDKDALIVV